MTAVGSFPRETVIDGEAISRRDIERYVEVATRSAESCGVGPGYGLAIGSNDALSILVGNAAAERLGATTVFPRSMPGDPSAHPRAAAVLDTFGAACRRTVGSAHGPTRLPGTSAYAFATSGSTGESKTVLLSGSGMEYQVHATSERMGITESDCLLLCVPLSHAYGFSVWRIAAARGAKIVINSRVQPYTIVSDVRRHEATSLDGVPGMYRMLLRKAKGERQARLALRSLRIRGCGGEILPAAMQSQFLQVVGAAIHDGYGLTEAGPNVALNAPDDTRMGTVGRPLGGVSLRLDADTSEILVRSPSTVSGYFEGDGMSIQYGTWIRTGDIGEVDPDGYLRVRGRLRETIHLNGEVMAPQALEMHLESLDFVEEAAISATRGPDEHRDRVHVFLVLAKRRRQPPSRTVIHSSVARVLPAGLRPHVTVLHEGIPRTASGKVDRRKLRLQVEDGHERRR